MCMHTYGGGAGGKVEEAFKSQPKKKLSMCPSSVYTRLLCNVGCVMYFKTCKTHDNGRLTPATKIQKKTNSTHCNFLGLSKC